MTASQSATVDMFRTVVATSDAHPAAHTGFAPFATPFAELKGLISDLDAAIIKQQSNGVATNQTKAELREDIVPNVVRFAAGLRLMGLSAGSSTEHLNKVTASDLREASEDKFYGIAARVIQDIDNVLPADLPDYGLDAAVVTATKTKMNTWQEMRKKGRHMEEEGSEATAQISTLIDKGLDILKRRLDPAVELLAANEAAFASEYTGSREIEDASYNTRALDVTITDAVGGAPIAGVKAAILPGNLIKTTADGGGFYVSNLNPGSYTMNLSRDGYVDKSVPFGVVAGQRTQIDESLTPA